MRRCFALSLALATSVEGFLPAPGVSSFVSKSGSYGTGLNNERSGLPAARQRAAMSADGGKVLVTGFLNSKQRTDQFVFDILQAQGRWEKIVAFSDSVAFAKKRLVSRKSRYSGLLDVLEFEEGDRYDAATMEEKLKGISAWLCFDCEGDKIKESVEFAKKAGVKSMVISSTVSAADASSAGVEDALKDSGLEYTFIRVGEVVEGKEGGSVTVGNVTDELPVEQVVRDDIVRLSAEAFMMENATNTAFAFGKGDDIALAYLKELRQNGTDRRTEMSTLISGGFLEYQAMKEAEEAEKNKPPPSKEELEAREKAFQEEREAEYAAIREQNAIKRQEDDIKLVEKEAREFLEKEWNAQFWSRTTSLTEEEYFEDEDNWDRAMKHGYDVVNTARGFPPKYKKELEGEEEAEDDDDDEDDEEDEPKEADTTTSSEDNAVSVTKPTKSGSKTDVEVSKEITAESKDEESDGPAESPKAKLD
ncbi:unnamed protein product [Ectocarpus sp. CCAP 1310/34]|nr:unnamed protein product [Ectocarpus sp. CCAP 1310/34]